MTPEESSAPGRIVVGVDGSPSSHDALTWAARQAHMTGSTPRDRDDVGMAGELRLGGARPRRLRPRRRRPAARSRPPSPPSAPPIPTSASILGWWGTRHRSWLRPPKERTSSWSGSRGHGEFVGMLLGSVSEYCATNAHCPVLSTARPPRRWPSETAGSRGRGLLAVRGRASSGPPPGRSGLEARCTSSPPGCSPWRSATRSPPPCTTCAGARRTRSIGPSPGGRRRSRGPGERRNRRAGAGPGAGRCGRRQGRRPTRRRLPGPRRFPRAVDGFGQPVLHPACHLFGGGGPVMLCSPGSVAVGRASSRPR